MIIKIQEDGNPIGNVFFTAFTMSVDEKGHIIVYATDSDNKSYRQEFEPSSYQIVIEKEDDAKMFYKKHM